MYLWAKPKIVSTEKKLFLLDGHALVYRAHYAFITRPLINSKGLNTSAITGFVRTLWDLIKNQKPTHLAVSFDLSGGTFRNEIYPAYKANRDAQPEDITTALPYIKSIIEAFNIPIVSVQNYEADDVIGALAKQAEKEGFKVFMVTPDKDYAQLVSENIFMYKPGRKGKEVDIMGVQEVLDKWGIKRIDQVIDVLGLQGDAVDNIPGIPGIGPKTAVKLLAAYDNIEGIIEHAEELKGKQKERVIEFADQARLSKILATIDLNVPVKFDAESYKISDFNRAKLAELFKDLEFRTLATAILGSGPGEQKTLFANDEAGAYSDYAKGESTSSAVNNINNVDHDYIFCDSSDKINLLIKKLEESKIYCFDTETTGLNSNDTELVGMSFSIKEHEAYYVPVSSDQSEAQKLVDLFKPSFENSEIEKIAQNIKFDGEVLKLYGVELKGKFHDTMIMHYLLEPSLRHNMDYLSESYLKYSPVSITELIGKKGKNQLSMRDIPAEKVSDYAAEDADITLQLYNVLAPKLKEAGLQDLYDNMEEPLIKVLIDMEHEGVNVDENYLAAYSKELTDNILEIEKSIHEQAGTPFNIASPKQVGNVLFEHLKIPYRWRKTATAQYSTDEAKLSELSAQHKIIKDILLYRTLAKLKSTYVDALPKMLNARTNRIHSSFNQALAATGRLSSNKPNLQNIPIKTPQGRKVREAFVPRNEDYILLAADYSQIELRLIAEISKDEAMLDAFQKNQDIHRATAARVYSVPYDEVTDDQRRNAKTVNFSITYGAGSTNLSRQLGISRGEAKELIEAYFEQYKGLKSYMDTTVEFARNNGYVETMLGRKRTLRDINSRNQLARSGAERVAVNSPIQGTAADMIKMAMIDIHAYIKDNGLKSKMTLQVHDELVFDIYKPELADLKPIIEEKMKNAIPDLSVPILVGMGTGENWLQAH